MGFLLTGKLLLKLITVTNLRHTFLPVIDVDEAAPIRHSFYRLCEEGSRSLLTNKRAELSFPSWVPWEQS